MGAQAVQNALAQGNIDPASVQAVYVGNMMSGMLSKQQHLGPLIANAAGLDLVEATTAEVWERREERERSWPRGRGRVCVCLCEKGTGRNKNGKKQMGRVACMEKDRWRSSCFAVVLPYTDPHANVLFVLA